MLMQELPVRTEFHSAVARDDSLTRNLEQSVIAAEATNDDVPGLVPAGVTLEGGIHHEAARAQWESVPRPVDLEIGQEQGGDRLIAQLVARAALRHRQL